MSEEKSVVELLKSLEVIFDDLLVILKAMSNEKRLVVLISLLAGEKTFNELKEETELKKTALANHLNQLLEAALISRPEYNKYLITSDGELFIRTLESSYRKSKIREIKQADKIQRGSFSDLFVSSFFGNT